VNKEVEQVRKTLSRNQLLAGSEILRALAVAADFSSRNRQPVFARQAYYGWMLGSVLE
jgi:hypothetical protein